MSFSISVHSSKENSEECVRAIDKQYFELVGGLEGEGEDHVFFKVGEFFGLDVSPLGTFCYTDEDPDPDDIADAEHDAAQLRDMVDKLIKGLKTERGLPLKMGLEYKDVPSKPENFKEAWVDLMTDPSKLADAWEEQEKLRIQQDTNFFIEYFNSGKLIEHLELLLQSIDCYIGKGASTVYFTAE
jgi:hypothetical protein